MTDPYVYPGTDVLMNRAGIRNLERLRRFERLMTAQRIAEGFPAIRFDAQGFGELHRHVFQDVYAWAGLLRTVDIAKPGALFWRPQFLAAELNALFELLAAGPPLDRMTKFEVAGALASHIAEVNAIHAFRKGNGRVLHAFMPVGRRSRWHEMAMA